MIAEAQIQRDPPVLLCRVKNPGVNAPPVPLGWDLYIGRRQHRDGLLWLVCPAPGGRVPTETRESILAKIALSQAKGVATAPIEWHEFDGQFEGLICPLTEGEQIAPYFRSREEIPEATGYTLLRLVLAEISRWADSPDLLESIKAEDLLVSLSYGVRVRIVLALGFSFLREPRHSDETALQWHCLSLISELYRAMHHAEGTSHSSDRNKLEKPFQKLERRWRAGKWKGIEPVLAALDEQLQKMEKAQLRKSGKGGSAMLFATRPSVRPQGMVARFLADGFRKSYPDKLAEQDEANNRAPFSPYVLLGQNPKAEKDATLRYTYLLPPEDWLVDGFVNAVNQKLIHPFLSDFEGTTRFRAVYSEERFTAVVGDPEKGIPLPMFGYLAGFQSRETILLLRRFLQLQDELEAEGVKLQLLTPWQLQLHRVETEEQTRFAWNHSLEAWPQWKLKIRTETPTEHLIAEPSETCWSWVFEGLDRKFLPALASWLLGLSEFRDDENTSRIQSRGFHPAPEIQALFESSRSFFQEEVKEHRHRLIDLLEEGLHMISP